MWLIGVLVLCGCASLLGFVSLSQVSTPQPLLASSRFVNPDEFTISGFDPYFSFLAARLQGQEQIIENNSHRTGIWQAIAGGASSEPFRALRFLMVPVRGLTYEAAGPGPYPLAFRPGDASVALVCERDGRRIELLTAPSQQWFQRVMAVPAQWCSSEARIVARAVFPGVQIGFGTPFRVGFFDWLASGVFGATMALALALLVVGLQTVPWLVDADAPALRRVAYALLWLVGDGLLLSALGYHGVGAPVLTAIALAGVAAPSGWLAARLLAGNVRLDLGAIAVWLAGLVGVGGLTVLTYWLLPLGDGSCLPNYAFAPVTWSTDNQLSVMMAKSLLQRGPEAPAYLGPWSITDRGVAPAGMLSGLFLLLRLVGGFENNAPVISHLFQCVMQACVVPTVLLVLRDDGWSARRLVWMAACLALSPFVFFNSFYVWPKLLPGVLGVLGALLGARWLRAYDMRALALSILCLGSGPLMHSAAWLALPATARCLAFTARECLQTAGWLAAMPRRASAITAAVAGAAAIVGLWAQASLASPTSYGETFLLTGTGAFGLDKAGVESAVRQFYATIGWHGWLLLKWKQIQELAWQADPFFAQFCAQFCAGGSGMTCLRMAQFTSLLPSYGPAPWLLGAAAMLTGRDETGGAGAAESDLRRLAVACLLLLPVFIAVFNLPLVVHHLPYTLVLAPLVALLTWLPERRAILGWTVVGIQAANLAVVWFAGAWMVWRFDYGMP